MRIKKLYLFSVITALLLSSCSLFKDRSKGADDELGTQRVLIDKDGKSRVVGAKVEPGFAVSADEHLKLSEKFDKIAKKLALIDNAEVESFTDKNELKALKLSFKADELFVSSGDFVLKPWARAALSDLSKILKREPLLDVLVLGHSDNVGTLKENQKLSFNWASAVASYLHLQAVPKKQIKKVSGRNFSDPLTSNETEAGRAKNRRVELLLYASDGMIKEQASK